MRFVLGLAAMSREEQAALSAHLQCVTSANVLRLETELGAAKLGKVAGRITTKLKDMTGTAGPVMPPRRVARPGAWLEQQIAGATTGLLLLPGERLSEQLEEQLAELSGYPGADLEAIGEPLIRKAARHAGIATDGLNVAQIEAEVVNRYLEELTRQTVNQARQVDEARLPELESAVEAQMAQLSAADRAALGKFLGAEGLSSKEFVAFLKTTAGVGVAQAVLSGTGFGAYLFLATAVKSLSLLTGVTVPFAAYTGLSSALAFALSPVVFVAVASVVGFVLWRKVDAKLEGKHAEMVVVAGALKHRFWAEG